ncbi:MAG: flavodoxin [Anaerolineae bacterium]|nr:flavodoxin [Anaerolineae bacterium]
MPLAWNDLYFSEAGSWDRYVLVHERYTQYNWGIPGGLFFDLEQAKAWIRDQFNNAPVHSAVKSEADAAAETAANAAAKRVGLFYGSSSGVTEYIAEKVQAAWSAAGMQPITAVNIGTVKDLGLLLDYDYLLLGVPTWNIGQLQDDWDILFPQLDRLDFSGKHIAMFGIGDQQNYAENFLDALGILGNKLIERGATLVGYWNDGKYEFTASRGYVDGKFMGLGIDEEQQAALTAQRIQQWIAQVATEFKLEQVALSE